MQNSVNDKPQRHDLLSSGHGDLGWTPFFQRQYEQFVIDSVPARVVGVHRQIFSVICGDVTLPVSLAGDCITRKPGHFRWSVTGCS